MKDNPKDGGPAFIGIDIDQGIPYPSWMHHVVNGMSKRDFFAVMAPSKPNNWYPEGWDPGTKGVGDSEDQLRHEIAWRYKYADAMLLESTKPSKEGEGK